jgi:hypothetical protein
MQKQGVFILSVVLALAPVVTAAIGQTQQFGIGAANLIDWAGGLGSARGQNEAAFSQYQVSYDRFSGASAGQSGNFGQVGTISNSLGPSSVAQTAAINGSQRQAVGCGPGWTSSERQTLTADLGSLVIKPAGIGSAGGMQHFSGSQMQTMMTPHSTATQSQGLRTSQYTGITTTFNVDPLVSNTLNVHLNQDHTIGGQSLWTPPLYDP